MKALQTVQREIRRIKQAIRELETERNTHAATIEAADRLAAAYGEMQSGLSTLMQQVADGSADIADLTAHRTALQTTEKTIQTNAPTNRNARLEHNRLTASIADLQQQLTDIEATLPEQYAAEIMAKADMAAKEYNDLAKRLADLHEELYGAQLCLQKVTHQKYLGTIFVGNELVIWPPAGLPSSDEYFTRAEGKLAIKAFEKRSPIEAMEGVFKKWGIDLQEAKGGCHE